MYPERKGRSAFSILKVKRTEKRPLGIDRRAILKNWYQYEELG